MCKFFFALTRDWNRFSAFDSPAKSRTELKKMRHAMNFHREFEFRGLDYSKFWKRWKVEISRFFDFYIIPDPPPQQVRRLLWTPLGARNSPSLIVNTQKCGHTLLESPSLIQIFQVPSSPLPSTTKSVANYGTPLGANKSPSLNTHPQKCGHTLLMRPLLIEAFAVVY